MNQTSTQALDATACRRPAEARALLAVLLAPLIALLDKSLARLFGRLEDLMAQFRAGALPESVPAAPAPVRAPRQANLAPRPADRSWLTRLLELASQSDDSTAPLRQESCTTRRTQERTGSKAGRRPDPLGPLRAFARRTKPLDLKMPRPRVKPWPCLPSPVFRVVGVPRHHKIFKNRPTAPYIHTSYLLRFQNNYLLTPTSHPTPACQSSSDEPPTAPHKSASSEPWTPSVAAAVPWSSPSPHAPASRGQ